MGAPLRAAGEHHRLLAHAKSVQQNLPGGARSSWERCSHTQVSYCRTSAG
ncbi:hypothetical protein [Kitasatospora terrestris]